jgi:hypothetical protein
MPSTPMPERRAAVKCITRVPKEKKEATMMNLYYTVETKSASLELILGRGTLYRRWSLFHEEAAIAPAAVLEISDSVPFGP